MESIDATHLTQVLRTLLRAERKAPLRLVALDDACDARIVSERMVGADEGFVPLWQDRYVLAMPLGHALSLKTSVSLKDLDGVAFIERCACEALGEVAALLKRHKVRPETIAQAKTEDWAAALVASGLGCALLPFASAQQHKDIQTCEIEASSWNARWVWPMTSAARLAKGCRICWQISRPSD